MVLKIIETIFPMGDYFSAINSSRLCESFMYITLFPKISTKSQCTWENECMRSLSDN